MCDHVQALSREIIQDKKEAVTLIPLSSKCVGLNTPCAFINRGPGGISHPRVNKGRESVDHQLKGLNKHGKHRSWVCLL